MQMRIYCLLERSDLTGDSDEEPGQVCLSPGPKLSWPPISTARAIDAVTNEFDDTL